MKKRSYTTADESDRSILLIIAIIIGIPCLVGIVAGLLANLLGKI